MFCFVVVVIVECWNVNCCCAVVLVHLHCMQIVLIGYSVVCCIIFKWLARRSYSLLAKTGK